MKYGIQAGKLSRWAFVLVVLFAVTSCATYYQSNYSFNQEFESGDLQKALDALRAKSSEGKSKREFLYFVNNGLVLSMLGRYEESNEYFEKAYLFGEDYRRNYLNEAASYLTNPNFTAYKGEDHEHLVLLYYKAMNYLKLGKSEEALVECRRLNIRLQQLSDRYDSENKYREDAFIHNLMGIIYESDRDYNNAFIAYRNAYEIYQNSYHKLFNLSAPEQLKKDLLRAAFLSGLRDELEQWKTTLEMPDYEFQQDEAQLVFFWHNGLSPVKAEWSVNFVISRKGDWLYFNNPDLNLAFPFNIENREEKEKSDLADLEIFRVAFPRYVERPPYFQSASIKTNNQTVELETAEDINRVAFKSLEQRMHLEFSKALLRAALKKVAEHQLRKSDKALGSVLGMINAITEKADTRNWQTLPYQIAYCRVPLKAGGNSISLLLHIDNKEDIEHNFNYEAKKGQTLFHTFTSLESKYPTYGYY